MRDMPLTSKQAETILNRQSSIDTVTSPVMLIILDGWGYGEPSEFNAVTFADTPNMDRWMSSYPFTTLVAHGGAVGLPDGQMGNSEVGHLNIGAGRTVYQDFTRINRAIESKEFSANHVLNNSIDQVITKQKSLHLLGLVSDGGVHSHIDHLVALVQLASEKGLKQIYIHAFMDGRDTPPQSGADYLKELQNELDRIGIGKIASISGRYYAMDRDNRWQRVEKAWVALVEGEGVMSKGPPVAAVQDAYRRGETDEFIKPIVITEENGMPSGTINDGDTVLFFNFRADRARELSHAFTDPDFTGFNRRKKPALGEYVTFTQYDKHFSFPVVFPPLTLNHILGEEVSRHGLKQLRIAETEKYAHVTYFFNGGREEPFALEDRALIPSPKDVATYDQKPEMSAFAVTDELMKRLDGNGYSLIVLNFANGDMVGHTGIMAAAVAACEAVDQCLGRVVKKITAANGTVLITADHGNAETMHNFETNGPFTAHSSNPVPFLLINDLFRGRTLRKGGALRDIAPTILTIMGLPIPAEMDGECLLETS
jgi:2,3-bisphosphoglycerate-independent phosphoglycerate mutase